MTKLINNKVSKVLLLLVGVTIIFVTLLFFYRDQKATADKTGQGNQVNKNLEVRKLEVVYIDGTSKSIDVEIAHSDKEQEVGLMNRQELGENKGMLFTYDKDVRHGFWMKNTLIPLDIYFINEDMKVIDSKLNFEPCKVEKCPLYVPPVSYRYALEVEPQEMEIKNVYFSPL